MSLKEGDRVEIITDDNGDALTGEQGRFFRYGDGLNSGAIELDNPVGNNWDDYGRSVNKKGDYYLWMEDRHLKLIKKGDSKMEETKEIKGLKVKLGSKIYDTNCSNLGIVIAGTPEHCIYKDLSDNKEHVSSWNNIKLEIQAPNKLLLPREEKKVKKKKK